MEPSKTTLISNKINLDDIEDRLCGNRLLVRVDYNVPLHEGKVTDARRIEATVPTIVFMLERDPECIILMSHLGRPDGQRKKEYSLEPCCAVLEEKLKNATQKKFSIKFLHDCCGSEVEDACFNCNHENGCPIFLLENLRFHVEEEGKGIDLSGNKIKATEEQIEKFCESLTKLGDIYINDAFGTSHRAHSSIVGIGLGMRVAGFLLKRELEYFGKALENPERPFLAILGGAKVGDKILLIENLLDKVDRMIIGGGMAFTFKKVLNDMPIGRSLYDEEGSKCVESIINKARKKNVQLLFPIDFVITDKFHESEGSLKIITEEGVEIDRNGNPVAAQTSGHSRGIPDPWQGLDCGPKSVQLAKDMILSSKTIVWNGPPGRFEWPRFARGSVAFIEAVVEATQKYGATSIIGGGDTASLLENSGKAMLVSHVSTGGGAALELLEGKVLPGVECLTMKHKQTMRRIKK